MLHDLQRQHPEMEIWWDSMPTSLPKWVNRAVEACSAQHEHRVRAHWEGLKKHEGLGSGLIKSATTNPRLFLENVLLDLPAAKTSIRDFLSECPNATDDELYWQYYKAAYAQEAALWRAEWEASAGRHGWVCAQLPPSSSFDVDRMERQGLELARIAPNVMVKVVGSAEGYQVIERLVSQGVAINNTLSFSVPQFLCALGALSKGHRLALEKKVDMTRWRAVITHMTGRFGGEPEFRQQATERDIKLTPQLMRQAEWALIERIEPLVKSTGLPIKMLLCSLRVDIEDGVKRCFHIEQSRRSMCAYTIPPALLMELLDPGTEWNLSDTSGQEPVPARALQLLRQIPYFLEAWDPAGMTPENFRFHPAFLTGLQDVHAAWRRGIDIVRLCRFE
ncbi:transaldolase family protein [Trinickia acidisoli]|uniref:transaldolase family protein n=1 Tax=Trinickia acidisoli TaxID=2767482 RepID=UPI001A8E4705|nr:transaldolase family protein [Trinickia acidisoli]